MLTKISSAVVASRKEAGAERFLKEGTRSWALCHLWLADTAAGDRNVEGFVKLTSPH